MKTREEIEQIVEVRELVCHSDQGRHQAHGQSVMSSLVAFLGALGVLRGDSLFTPSALASGDPAPGRERSLPLTGAAKAAPISICFTFASDAGEKRRTMRLHVIALPGGSPRAQAAGITASSTV
jgi:hypothetical protein